MADKKLSQLTALTGAGTASGDLLYIVDVSEPIAADQSKKITLTEFQSAPISAGTANGVAYLDASKVLTTGSALTFDGTRLGITAGAAGEALRLDSTGDTYLSLFRSGALNAYVQSGGGGVVYLWNTQNGATLFGVNNAEQMRLTSTGLGIGTSSPTNKLTVNGNANITGNTTLGDASTDTVTVNGYMGVGGAPNNAIAIRAVNTALAGASQYGFASDITGTSSATSAVYGYYARINTAAAVFTTSLIAGLIVKNTVLGAGSTITDQHGVYIENQSNGTNNYGITSLVSSGTNKWNIYASGTADNYFAGNVGIGTSSPAYKLDIITPNTNGFAGARIRNNDAGSSAYAGLILNASGNSWGIRMGSVATNSNALQFAVDALGTPSTLMTLTTSGNLGLGVTPSAWGGSYKAFQTGAGSFANYNNASLAITQNAYDSGAGSWTYLNTAGASFYQQTAGVHYWYTAPSGTAGNAITFSQSMTLDASGNLGLGTTSPGGSSTSRQLSLFGTTSQFSAQVGAFTVNLGNNATLGYVEVTSANPLAFFTNSTERARIKSTGQFRFVPLAADPAGAEAGDVYYNSGTNKLRLYDGTSWVDLN